MVGNFRGVSNIRGFMDSTHTKDSAKEKAINRRLEKKRKKLRPGSTQHLRKIAAVDSTSAAMHSSRALQTKHMNMERDGYGS